MDLFVHTDQQYATTVVHLAGSLTAGTASVLETALVELFTARTLKIVVDLAGVTVCDNAGVALLAGAAAVATDRGGEIRLAAPPPGVSAWLRVGDLMAQVATFGTVAGAVRADPADVLAEPRQPPQPWTVPAAQALAATRSSARHDRPRTRTNRPTYRGDG